MYNIAIFNSAPTLPTTGAIPWYVASTDQSIVYNGYELNNKTTRFAMVKWLQGKSVSSNAVSDRSDGNYYAIFEKEREITVEGTIQANSREDLISAVDALKTAVLVPKQWFEIREGTYARRVKAVAQTPEFSENSYNITWIDYKITFQSFDYMQDITGISETISLAWGGSTSFVRQGSSDADLYISGTISGASGASNPTLTINGKTLTLSTSIVNGDTIEIYGENYTVKKNGSTVNTIGAIQKLDASTTTVSFALTGTATFSFSLVYHPSYK